ncbi:uncharacterized protein BCR38DRAFT_439563 [Pseudomassariella vexata]|uniref:DUF7704 domain-containing protein n=1 Tax=Pseudomassariella vexata TaxID=1141098 RepID=A0A1Y2DPI5_9PEZI|nr:uncharacterized protein BCR38DRAFT_439563 [Pseudomassariella vexata]ORY61201.1 hypothetical protein BCR38DRAFT_439563 [Pseudomassariella vexata]
MAITSLPAWPLILFGVLEPIALGWAWITTMNDPFQYFNDQAPNYPQERDDFPPQALILTLMMANVLLLLAAVAVICCFTTRASVTKWYLFAVALADFGHIYATYKGVGPEHFWNLGKWNHMVWGNVGVSAFLNVNRWLTLLGAFGTGRPANVAKKNM